MGYTVVAGFDRESKVAIKKAVGTSLANKIPYGRNCDREAANRILDYHITLIHWGKEYDRVYLPCLDRIKMIPCKVKITGTFIMMSKEGSYLLYFKVEADERFHVLSDAIYSTTGISVSSFLHMTLHVDKDYSKVQKLKEQIDNRTHFPIRISINSLDVYHIWNPVYLAKRII